MVLSHQLKLAINKISNSVIVLLFQIVFIYSLITKLFTCFIYKPKFLANKKICLMYKAKILLQNFKLSKNITFNIKIVLLL